SSHGLHLKTYVFLLFMVTFGPLGDVFLADGMKKVGALNMQDPVATFHFFVRAFSSGQVWLGVILLLAFFISYTLVLSWADFSFVKPASSLSYVIVALLGHFFLRDVITPVQSAGIALLGVGVLIGAYTPPRTT